MITDKDILKAIMNNQIPLDNLLINKALIEKHRLIFDHYGEHLLSDILQR